MPGDRRVWPAALVVAAGAGAVAATGDVPGWEAAASRSVYDLPDASTGAFEVAMQAGTRGAIVVLAVGLLVARRRRAALAVALGGAAAWLLAVLGKRVVGRGRPTDAALGRPVRELVEGGGLPSSHAAIAAACATALLLTLPLPRAVRLAVVVVAVATALARVHLGVHWVLDVVAGSALGVATGAAASRLTGGRRA